MIFGRTDNEIYDKEHRLLQKSETAETDKTTPTILFINSNLWFLTMGFVDMPTISQQS
jgi:hypothetical protein